MSNKGTPGLLKANDELNLE